MISLPAATATLAQAAPAAAPTVIRSIDLTHPFDTRTAWSLTVTQGPPTNDPDGLSDDQVPGVVTVCLRQSASAPCNPQLQRRFGPSIDTLFGERHYLDQAAIVRAHGRPILLVVTASQHSGDGDQLVLTQAMAYQPGADRFASVYQHVTRRNNNQEVRFIEAGPLAGDIIAVDPADSAPYGYWVVVNAPDATGLYRQVLRYRSTTLYNDGNTMPVIDSEMANIQRRLGLWRPGLPLPLPASACPKPRLAHGELWCE